MSNSKVIITRHLDQQFELSLIHDENKCLIDCQFGPHTGVYWGIVLLTWVMNNLVSLNQNH